MRFPSALRLIALSGAGLLLGACSSSVGQTSDPPKLDPVVPTYSVTVIPPTYHLGVALAGEAYAIAINDSGTVVGALSIDPAGAQMPYVWTPSGGIQMITLPAGTMGGAGSISAAGVIVGSYRAGGVGSPNHGFRVAPESLVAADIGLPAGASSLETVVLADSGRILVKATLPVPGSDLSSESVFGLTGTAFTNLGLEDLNYVYLIGKSDYAYGHGLKIKGTTISITSKWVWNGTSTTILPDTFYDKIKYGVAGGLGIGPQGQILAVLKDNSDAALLFPNGTVQDLGFYGSPMAMNASGVVVGNDGDNNALYYSAATGAVNLNSRIASTLSLKLTTASAISASGTILCAGVYTGKPNPYGSAKLALVLTPNP